MLAPPGFKTRHWPGATGPSLTGVRRAAHQCFLNRRRLYQLSPPDWFVGLRHNTNDFVFRIQQRLQCRHADIAGADENDSHAGYGVNRSEEHTSELQSLAYLVCRLLLEK